MYAQWFRSYSDFQHLLEQHIRKDASILILGTGNSQLPLDMARDGYSRIIATDISRVVIHEMAAQAEAAGLSHITWLEADMLALPFKDAAYDVVLEKGTMDVLFVDSSAWETPPEVQHRVDVMLGEVHR